MRLQTANHSHLDNNFLARTSARRLPAFLLAWKIFSQGGTKTRRSGIDGAIGGSSDPIANERFAEIKEVAELEPDEKEVGQE